MIEAKRSVYDHVIYDSGTETKMAEFFEKNDAVINNGEKLFDIMEKN